MSIPPCSQRVYNAFSSPPLCHQVSLDVHQIVNERDRFIEARISQRISELEGLDAMIDDGGFDSLAQGILGAANEQALLGAFNGSAPAPSHPAPNAHGKLRGT
jgi:ATP-dependent helicase STH1/SNF2